MSSNASEQSRNLPLIQNLKIGRRILTDDIHPLSLIMMDLSSLGTLANEINYKNKKTISIITEILKDNTRKTDIKTFIHKTKFALFLPNTPGSGAHILSDRIFEEIKKVLNKDHASLQKNNHIMFQISTYLKTSQGNGELEIFNEQYKKSLNRG